MTKANLLLIYSFLLYNSLISQGGFVKRYEIQGYDSPYFTTILASDTIYWAFGIIWDTTAPYYAGTTLFKFDLEGNVLKQKDFISKTQFLGFNNDMNAYQNKLYTSILVPYDSSSIIAYDIFEDTFRIAKTIGNFLPQGDFLSVNNLNFDNLGNSYLATAVASSFTLDSFDQIQLVKLNQKFEVDWIRHFGKNIFHDIPYSLVSDTLGNIYVGCLRIKDYYKYNPLDIAYSRGVIYKLDSLGIIQKEIVADSLSGAIYDFIIDSENNYICATEVLLPYAIDRPFSYPAIMKLSPDGHIIWRKFFEEIKDESLHQIFSKIKKTINNNGYVSIGGINVYDDDINPNISEERSLLVNFDNDGKIKWKRIYKTAIGVEGTFTSDINITSDGGYVFDGLGSVGTNSDLYWKAILVKVDSNGCLIPGCQLTDNTAQQADKVTCIIYPNPTSDFLYFYNSNNQNLHIQIFDSQNNVLVKCNSVPKETTIFDIKKYAAGPYWIYASRKGIPVWSTKFIKT